MTPTKYIICRMFRLLGYSPRSVRMGDASSEFHLLSEAESQLGQQLWQEVEEIQDLSVEYWNLRKYDRERTEIVAELEALEQGLEGSRLARISLLSLGEEQDSDLTSEKNDLLNQLGVQVLERDKIFAKALEVKRIHQGLSLKQEVLHRDGNQEGEELDSETNRRDQLQTEFEKLRQAKETLAKLIEETEQQIREVEVAISERKAERNQKASVEFLHIGESNQQMSSLRVRLRSLDSEMRLLYQAIGKYLSQNSGKTPVLKRVCKNHRGLIALMGALLRSIQYNQKLARLD